MACQVILEKIPDVDAVDFNLGCPQECASKGKYGAFLLEEPSVTEDCVKALCESLPSTVPVFCKIRRAETIEETIKYGRLLEHSGCKLLAIHCRLRKDKHASVPDYSFAKALVENLGIPIVANGGINSRGMARKVMEKTGCVGCMVATELLRNPKCGTLGDSTPPDPASLALEYLYFCEKYPPPSSLYIRKHLRWIFRMELEPSMHDSSRSFSEAVESEGGWRIKLWTFLVRPYLDSLWQFRKLIEYYQYMASGVDFRPKADYNPPTLRSIKAGFEYNSDGQTEPGNEETGIGNLFI
jgi:tRNA-dihydrouridine synthase